MNRALSILATLVVTIGIDQWTKALAVTHLKHKLGHSYMGDFFKLIYAENTGAFLGSGSDFSETTSFWVLKVIPLMVLLGITAYLFFSKNMDKFSTAAFSLIVGGGLSNVVDRFVNNGSVVDFMNMGIGELRTGIFNFADVFIMIGVGLMLFGQFWISLKSKDKNPETET